MATVYADTLKQITTKHGQRVANHTGIEYNMLADDLVRLKRFLTIGTDGGTYYANERELTSENTKHLIDCLDRYRAEAVALIEEVSVQGLAPKQQPAIYALAIAAAHEDTMVRRAALAAVPSVCRTASTLFQFIEYVTALRGWGRTLKRAVQTWYNEKPVSDVAYQVVKYRNRNGWSHKDVLELGHVLAPRGDLARTELYNWIFNGESDLLEEFADLQLLEDFERLEHAENAEAIVATLKANRNLPFEAIPNQYLTDPRVWQQLVANGLPMTAMMRNLGRMTSLGIFNDNATLEPVLRSLENEDRIKKSRLHPMNILNALVAYKTGRSRNLAWIPNRHVIDALDGAFYKAFKNVEPTGKRILLAVDVSASMSGANCNGFENIRVSQASAAMSLVTLATERYADVVVFDSHARPSTVSARQRLDDVYNAFGFRGGSTNCAAPYEWARKQDKEYDAVVMYTDFETNFENRYTYGVNSNYIYDAIDAYRAQYNHNLRVVNVAMTANKLSFTRKTDRNMLDVAGFSSDTPQAISLFVGGTI